MARAQVSAASGSFALLNLAAGGLALQGVSLGADLAVVGSTFRVGGCLDPSTTSSDPNIAPLVHVWGPPTNLGQVDGWPVLAFTRLAGVGSGSIYASAPGSSLAAPFSTALPSVGSFLGSAIAMPAGLNRIMLDRAATSAAQVDVWQTESPGATSGGSGLLLGTLSGGGRFMDVNAGYLQLKPLALGGASDLWVAAISGGAGGGGISGNPPTVTNPTAGGSVVALVSTATGSILALWQIKNLGTGATEIQLVPANSPGSEVSLSATAGGLFALAVQGGDQILVASATGIAIGGNPDPSCILNLVSLVGGLGLPAMTTTEKNAISTGGISAGVYPALWDKTLGTISVWNGTTWKNATLT